MRSHGYALMHALLRYAMRWQHLPTRAAAAVVERLLTAKTTQPGGRAGGGNATHGCSAACAVSVRTDRETRDRAHGSRRPKGLDKAERFEPHLAAKLRALLSNVQTAVSGKASGGTDLF